MKLLCTQIHSMQYRGSFHAYCGMSMHGCYVILHLVLVDIGVQQLLVAAVDDSRAVTCCKDMRNAIAVEGLQHDGLAA